MNSCRVRDCRDYKTPFVFLGNSDFTVDRWGLCPQPPAAFEALLQRRTETAPQGGFHA